MISDEPIRNKNYSIIKERYFIKKIFSILCIFALFISLYNFSTVDVKASSGTTAISDKLLSSYDVETNASNIENWHAFQSGSCYIANFGKSGNKSVGFTGRTAEWHSPYIDVYNLVKSNGSGRYIVTFWMHIEETATISMNARVIIRGNANSFIDDYGSNQYAVLGRQYVAMEENSGRTWYKMSGAFDVKAADISSQSGSFKLMLDKIPISEEDDLQVFIDDIKLYKVNSQIKTSQNSNGYYIVNKETGRYLTAEYSTGNALSHIGTREKFSDDASESDKSRQIWYVGKTSSGYYIEKSPGQNCLQIENPSTEYYSPGSRVKFGLKQNGQENSQEFDIVIAGDGICYRICAQVDPAYFGLEVHSNLYDEGTEVRMGPSILAFNSAPSNKDLWYFIPLTYNSDLSVIYATINYDNKDNPTFPFLHQGELRGDCANFVSQCLYIAGKKMDSVWYIKKLNDDHAKPTTINDLDESWDVADPSPWISAKQFRLYWKEKVTTKEYAVIDIINTPSILYSDGFRVGDVITYCGVEDFEIRGLHTVIITGCKVVNNTYVFTVSQHSGSVLNKRIDESLNAYFDHPEALSNKVTVYKMR